MKKLLPFALLVTCLLIVFSASAQKKPEDKTKRLSPPDSVTVTTRKGITIKVSYGSPGVKGRAIGGNEIATYGKVWRTGANEATVFEIDKDVKIEGKRLPAGKYSLYSVPGEKKWVIIFNKTWNQWGTIYSEANDALRITVNTGTAPEFTERLKFNIKKSGKVYFVWGDVMVAFKVKKA
ncbi:hypothetical protein BDD43_5701 [Mucilaginibacter gracilis]|uniref:DUF2911 family protein n=1 Tax=Mucilaginibacter gracilis TaxID=423350 RepID=A0A495J8V2_9SPHI|nr:DUF2911 domain-containing protein [Mucilaginibacter gracilis]RKR85430.1 hypothetical protein BDD43_5701 [Mucilaginibacter gracilis]